MKNFLTAILIIFCFAGMTFAKTYNIKSDKSILELKKSDIIIFELPENPSTGFQWNFTSTNENVAKIIDKRLVYPPVPKGQPPLCGQGGTAVYKVKAINSGKAQINGKYVRPWERNSSGMEYTLNIEVK